VLGAITLGSAWLLGGRPNELPPRDRNVLLITIDTLRADAPGYAGGRAATPNLDRLAHEGWAFDFAHGHSVVTLPSHASILTGLYPFAHGIRDNSGYRLSEGTLTLATWLRGRGYATGAFVGAFPLDARFGLGAGFDTYDDRYPSAGRASELLMPERPANQVVEAATSWIRQQTGRWFAWVHVFDPHAPYQAPPPFRQQYATDPYAGEVAWVDHALGPLLELVRSADRPALVIVTADHGEALGDHGEATHGLFAYEATLRVPLIVAATDVGGGRKSGVAFVSRPARHIDVLPTIADSLGLPPPGGLPGLSLRPGAARPPDGQVASYFEALTASLNRGWAPLTGVLLGDEKFIDLPIPELYDLGADPAEQDNRHDGERQRVRALAAMLDRLRQGATPQSRAAEDSETRRRLEALGYVSAGAPARERYSDEDDPKRLVTLDQAMQRGVELFQQGNLEGARQVYSATIRQRPAMATPYLHLAYLEWESGEPGRAIETLRTGLAAGAVGGEMRSQLGIYLAEAGSPVEAVRVLEAAVKSEPGDIDALNGLGIALFRSGRTADAERAFRSALERDPTDVTAWENLGTLALSTGDLPGARRAFTTALARDPSLVGALNGVGVVESRSGNTAAAIEAWRRVVALDPRHFDALYNLASSLVKTGQRDAARPYLQQFAATAPPAFYGEDLQRVRQWLGQ
jgi:arylsulfatase A-like enzyme/Tfp pilus assembly protein PilF